jgi:hypothetical protein
MNNPVSYLILPSGAITYDFQSTGGGGPHTHPESDITNLVADLAAKAALSHSHAQSDIVNLVADLAAKAAASHGHAQSDITNLVADLAAKAAASHGHSQSDITNLVADLAAKAAASHSHAQSDITSLVSDLAGKASTSHTHAGLPVMARVPTTDATNSSGTTFTTLFTQAILASEVWSFEAILYWFAAAGTTGLVTQVDAPTSPTFSQCLMATAESATAWRNLAAAAGTPMVGTASATATIIPSYLSGTIENGANDGNIVIKFRSEVNTSLVTVKRGSWCRFFKH